MPRRSYAGLTASHVGAIVETCEVCPSVANKVLSPFGLDTKATVFRRKILPPDQASQQD